MPDLKPCPFCGGEVTFGTSRTSYYAILGEHGSSCVNVRCNKCSLDMYDHSRHVKDYDERIALLAKKWNRRVTDDNY